MKIAVVGGGIYGVTAAIRLSAVGRVTLFEQKEDILKCASAINHLRLHSGYHYPRSEETAISSFRAGTKFREEYPEAVITRYESFYCLAKERSLTSADEYLGFLKRMRLNFERADCRLVNRERVDLCIKVKENFMDPKTLHELCWHKLRGRRIDVRLKTSFTQEDYDNFDFVVIATYSQLNQLLDGITDHITYYQFEVVEKPFFSLPAEFMNTSVIVLDGPFTNINPYGLSDKFILGHVVQGIHQSNVGRYPEVAEDIKPMLNAGIIAKPKTTRLRQIIDSSSEFLPRLGEAQYLGSMFTVRAVLPHMELTDARPTVVQQVNEKVVSIFSGKMASCVEAADEVLRIATERSK